MTSLGFENYAEALKIYLSKYREVRLPDPPTQNKLLSSSPIGHSFASDCGRPRVSLRHGVLTRYRSNPSPTEATTSRTGPQAKDTEPRRALRMLRAPSPVLSSVGSQKVARARVTDYTALSPVTMVPALSIDLA